MLCSVPLSSLVNSSTVLCGPGPALTASSAAFTYSSAGWCFPSVGFAGPMVKPLGALAISLTSCEVRTSLIRGPRVCKRMVEGPSNCRNSYIGLAADLTVLMGATYPISPDGLPRPRTDRVHNSHCRLPSTRFRHVLDELGILDKGREALETRDLEPQGRRLEAIGAWGVGRHGVGHDVAT